MTPYYQDSAVTIYHGDALACLRELPEASVNCCVTSPPYWGLRDYGTARWEGGDAGCGHVVGWQVQDNKAPGAITTGQRPGVDASICRKCGARRIDAQLGLEHTPEEYVANMVAVFREVRRVLREDAVCWVNMGDSYNAAGRDGHGTRVGAKQGTNRASAIGVDHNRPTDSSLKPKDLVGIPWRLAFALQADGWYLRQDIIWHKPNPMPESVTDRCTKAHEYVFLLAKSERYWYDAEAVKETCVTDPESKAAMTFGSAAGKNNTSELAHAAELGHKWRYSSVRNRRSVWTVATQPYSGAHFATFPPALIKPMILAGCPAGGCVLDPFGGSGTTGYVAKELGRRVVLIELNEKYIGLAVERLPQEVLDLSGSTQ